MNLIQASNSSAIAIPPRRPRPWYRRFSARLGLQGKLILCFMGILTIALTASCWMFVSQSTQRLDDIMGEQARQMSYALSLASKSALQAGEKVELNRIGQDLIKSRNILFVVFLDGQANPVALASRDPEFKWDPSSVLEHNTQRLMQVRRLNSAVLGDYLEVVAPVLDFPLPNLVAADDAPLVRTTGSGTRLTGYVAVGISEVQEKAQLARIKYLIIGIGCVIAILSLPLAYVLVHRIFFPIRQLVDATDRIAHGDLGVQVAIHRPDVIGTLARSFNEMVNKVRRQQDALEASNLDLEQRVRQRTAQMEAANKRLSSEIAEKEDFLRAVSHDLNAPLRNISGMTTMLLMKNREKFDHDVIHRLERIQQNVQMETDLITELLELSRIKTRRQKMETVKLHEMVRELAGLFENDLKSKKIRLVLEHRLPVTVCEKARMRQVFQNLIDNAIKYMGDGKLREIRIGCRAGDDEMEFYVRDTGVGIDPQDLPKVFHVFRRGKSSSVQNIAGKGVGLSLVKSIIETYEGRIWVESELGKGSVFRFTINGKFLPALNDNTEELLKLSIEESICGMTMMPVGG